MKKKQYGISVYPERSTEQEVLEYLQTAAKYGFSRLFIALLAQSESPQDMEKRYGRINKTAKELGFEVCCDVNPMVFKHVGANTSFLSGGVDLSFFRRIYVDVLRLDLGMSEFEEAFLTRNREGIQIELNMGLGVSARHMENLILSGANPDMLMACMNYYPHRYTGVAVQSMQKIIAEWKPLGVRTAAFVSSQTPDSAGPWEICEGLPTVELHRGLPIDVQVKHFVLMGGIDDILIGNASASEEELRTMASVARDRIDFKIIPYPGVPESLLNTVTSTPLSRRPDTDDYMIRSIEGRFFGKKLDVPPVNTIPIRRGDVIMDNNLYGQYKGEVHIALKDMENSGKTNVIGHIAPEEVFLIDYVSGTQGFGFTAVTG